MKPVDFDDILKIVLVSNPEVSPDGSRIAYLVSKADHDKNSYSSSIWLATSQGNYYPLTRGPANFCPTWSSDGSLLAFIERPGTREEKGAYVSIVKPGEGEPWRLARFPMGVSSIQWLAGLKGIVALSRVPADDSAKWTDYSERVVLESTRIPLWFNGEGWVFDRFNHLYLATYPGGEVVRLTRGERNIVLFAVMDDKVVYAESYDMLDPVRHRLRIIDTRSMEDRVILDGYTISAIAPSPDGSRIAFRGHRRERGIATHHKIYTVDLDGNVECLTCGDAVSTVNSVNSDVRGATCTRQLYWVGDYIYFPVHHGGRVSIHRASPGGATEAYLDAGDAVIDEFSVSSDGSIAFTMMKPTALKEVYMLKDGRVSRVTDHNGSFHSTRRLIEPEARRVESDGRTVDYWVLRGLDNRDCRRCKPWILYIHGGPKTSYGYGFIHELQLLASKGFTVIYSNPRGSDGYSEDFADIRGRYGEDDYRDLMRVVDDALSHYEDLDPERGGVTGGSYGGWMTNWIITQTQRFKAAVTQRSCSNWLTFYGVSDIGWYFATDQHAAGPPWETPERYIDKSPLFMADKINTPLLIIHSTEDYRCPLEQAIQLFTALKVRGVETKIAIFPGENHDLSRRGRPKQRIERLKQILKWFEDHLKS